MNKILSGLILLACTLVLGSCQPTKTFTEKEIVVIPLPQKMALGKASFRLADGTIIAVENEEQKAIAATFAEMFEKVSGTKLKIEVGNSSGKIVFKTDPQLGPEAYNLAVSKDQIEIKASQPAGFFYAIQTLRQLLPPEIESSVKQEKVEWLVPGIVITDSPEFKWRGYMLDVSRHFFAKNEVMKMIDYMAYHKLNTFHFHLTDDQGWRIEIKKYPKLTQVGAWRVDREDKHWNSRPKQEAGEKATYGGFYTQEDIKEIVAYAKARYINVVPEIEMPAHVTAALAAYPQFSCKGGPFTVLPGGVWPITDIYCAGKDSTFLFIQDILTEVMDLFPSKYIHIGGDEATKTEWEKCPLCQKRVKTEKLKNVAELQSYFVKRIEKFVSSKGRTLIGWDEIIEGGLPAEATVMSWRGNKGGIEAATQGHDVVMSPNSDCYIDYYQGPMDQEPLAIGGYLPLSKVYQFSAIPSELSSEAAKHILGGQANLWTEYVPTIKHAEYMTFPRMAALAETFWSPKAGRNWDNFSRRIQLVMKHYDQMGLNYAKSAFKVMPKAAFDEVKKQLTVTLQAELTGVEIHYTIDGSEPTPQSPKYTEPVVLTQSSILKAVPVVDGVVVAKPVSQAFNLNKATIKPVSYLYPYHKNYKGSGAYTLVNGVRGTTNHSDGEWQGWEATNMEAVIDLQQQTEIRTISLGALQNGGAWIFLPSKVEFFISTDGKAFTKVGEVINDVDPLTKDKLLKDFTIRFNPVKTGYVKVVAANQGKGPKGSATEGKNVWLFVDEISVE